MSNPFKAFTAFTVNEAFFKWFSGLADADVDEMTPHINVDPGPSSWRATSFHLPKGGELVETLDGAGCVGYVTFNERILPAKVRDDKLKVAMDRIQADTGRKPSKKDYAAMRSEVEAELLPKAFIKRTPVAVMLINPNIMLVWAGGGKKVDDVVSFLMSASTYYQSKPVEIFRVTTRSTAVEVLTNLAREGGTDEFLTDDSAVLKGPNRRTVRIKDRAISHGEIQNLLNNEYQAYELRLLYSSHEDFDKPDLSFVLTESLVFKGLAMPDVKATMLKEDAHQYAYLMLRNCKNLLADTITLMGGMAEEETEDDDDEL